MRIWRHAALLLVVAAVLVQPAAAQGRSSEAGSSAFAEASADRRSLGGGWSDPADQRIDALGSEPSPKGQWRIGAFLGAAHNSPINPRLGTTPGRDHVFLGLQAQTTVLKMGAARLSYGMQVVPVVVIRGRTAPIYYDGSVDEEGLIPGSNTAYAFGVSPFAMELAVPLGGRVALYGAGAGGLIFFSKPFPVPDAHSSNFTIEYGGGLLVRVGQKHWVQAGYKYHHLSNAYRELVNPGVDAHVFYLGFWKAFGSGRPGL